MKHFCLSTTHYWAFPASSSIHYNSNLILNTQDLCPFKEYHVYSTMPISIRLFLSLPSELLFHWKNSLRHIPMSRGGVLFIGCLDRHENGHCCLFSLGPSRNFVFPSKPPPWGRGVFNPRFPTMVRSVDL